MNAALQTDESPAIETQTTTALALVTRSITEINAVESVIAELESQYKGVVFDVTTTEGMEAARKARQSIREPRYALQRMQKEAKAPLNQLKKGIDEQAEGYITRISALEDPVHQQIANEETRKENERQERIEAERKRVADLQERLAELRGCQMLAPTSGSGLIAEHISDLEKIPVDESFQEFQEAAVKTKAEGLERLGALHAAAIAHEAAENKLNSEREAQRLRERRMDVITDIKVLSVVASRGRTLAAYDAVIQQLERREITADEFGDLTETAVTALTETLAVVKRDRAALAEQLEQEAEAKRQRYAEEADRVRKAKIRERIDAIRCFADGAELMTAERVQERLTEARAFEVDGSFAEMRADAQAALDAVIQRLVDIHGSRVVAEAEAARLAKEAKKLADERASFQRQQEEARQASEAEEQARAEQARIASMKRPEADELVDVLAKHYRMPNFKVIEWLAATNWKKLKVAEAA